MNDTKIVGGAGPDHCDTCSTDKAKREPLNKEWVTSVAQRLAIVQVGASSTDFLRGLSLCYWLHGQFSSLCLDVPNEEQGRSSGEFGTLFGSWSEMLLWDSSPKRSVISAERAALVLSALHSSREYQDRDSVSLD